MSEHEKKQLSRIGVVAVVVSDKHLGKILAVREAGSNRELKKIAGVWSLPAGHLDYGVWVEDMLKIEIKEEAGVDKVEIKDLLGIYQVEAGVGIAYIVEATSEVDKSLVVEEEISEVVWIAPEEFVNLETRPAMKEIVEDYMAGQKFDRSIVRKVFGN